MTETRLALATDKQEITEVIYRFARAIDRCDKQLIASVFHPGATDDHGSFKGTAEEFADWVIPLLETMQFTQHAIANVLIEVKGDRAFAESYFRAYHRIVTWIDSSAATASGRSIIGTASLIGRPTSRQPTTLGSRRKRRWSVANAVRVMGRTLIVMSIWASESRGAIQRASRRYPRDARL
jgi:ketosteroid isomerase-like protein